MIYDLIEANDVRLRKKQKNFDFNNPPVDPNDLFESMKETMIAENGIGLSAVQVGLPWRMFIIGNPKEPDSIIPFFNPNLVNAFGEEYYAEEGCLTFPKFYVRVKRFHAIRIRFANTLSEVDTKMYEGMTARIIQHEYDHCEGILFTERATRFHMSQARNQYAKRQRRIEKVS